MTDIRMKSDLDKIFDRLKQVDIIQSEASYSAGLDQICKYAESVQQKAYLLGWFFKYKLDSDELPSDDKTALIRCIKTEELEAYYYLKIKPDFDEMTAFYYSFTVIGLIMLFFGILRLINGYFTVGRDIRYGIPVIREGGVYVIMGAALLGAGMYQVNRTLKKQRFLKSFLK